MNTKKRVNITIDADLFEKVRPYINNLSFFFETCLKNYIRQHQSIIDQDNYFTASYVLNHNKKDFILDESPNITYIMDNVAKDIPVQLKLFEIIGDKVISTKEKTLVYPTIDESFSFLSNKTLKLKNKVYYFEIEKRLMPERENQKAEQLARAPF